MDDNSFIRLEGVTLGYGRKIALSGLNLAIRRGDYIGIVGPNGCGKTTILRALCGLIRPLRGRLHRDGRIRYGYVKQRQFLDPIWPLCVHEVVMMGRCSRMGLSMRPGPADRQKVREATEITGVAGLTTQLYRELSEGQKQRVLLARAMASEPDVLLLDEPTNDLDIKGQQQIMRLVDEIHQRLGVTVVMVSHFLDTVLNHARQFLFLHDNGATLHTIDELSGGPLLRKIYDEPITLKNVEGRYVIIPGADNQYAR